MRKLAPEIKQAIWERYAPRTADGEIDPAVLWVGSLLDGLSEFMPEAARLVVRSQEDNPLTVRHRIKRLIMDIVNPATKQRDTAGRGESTAGFGFAQISFKREPASRWVRLDRRILTIEPGELVNSVQVVADPETNEGRIVETVRGSNSELVDAEPKIREDKVTHLHYLLRGDQFRIEYSALGRNRTLLYELVPVAEGSSLKDF